MMPAGLVSSWSQSSLVNSGFMQNINNLMKLEFKLNNIFKNLLSNWIIAKYIFLI